MRINPAEVEAQIKASIAVTRQQVTLAKGFLQNLPSAGQHDVEVLVNQFCSQQGYARPHQVVVHPDVPLEPSVLQAVGYLAPKLAIETPGAWT